jgi:Uma2 family endonuclease
MTFVGFPSVTDADLLRLGELNPGWSFERNDEGAIEVCPTGWKSGKSSVEAVRQLTVWAATAGGAVFDSSTGFRMPSKAVRSPDASWVTAERLERARQWYPNEFFPGAPDIAIEIASPSNVWADVVAKGEMYVRHGSGYAVAIDLESERCSEAGAPPSGFRLDIAAVRRAGH